MAPPTLITLPPETTTAICGYLPLADLPTVRLLSKTFCLAVTPRLFRAIPLWMSMKSLSAFSELSRHALRHHVEEIVFSTIGIDGKAAEHFPQIKDASSLEEDSLTTVVLRYGKYELAFQSLLREQEYLAGGNIGLNITARALKAFARLHAVTIYHSAEFNERLDYYSDISSKELIDRFASFPVAEFLTRDGRQTLPIFVEALALSERKILNFTIGVPNDFLMRPHKFPTSLPLMRIKPDDIGPYFTRKHRMRELSAEAFKHAFDRSFFQPWEETPLSKVTVIHMTKMGEESGDMMAFGRILRFLNKILHAAKALKSLTIDEICYGSGIHTWFEEVIHSSYAPDVQCLNLFWMHVRGESLIEFVKQRAPILVHVKFEGFNYNDMDMADILNEIRTVPFSQLQSLIIDGGSGHNDEIHEKILAHDYMLHKTDKNPVSGVEHGH